jgi:hypothetical protein
MVTAFHQLKRAVPAVRAWVRKSVGDIFYFGASLAKSLILLGFPGSASGLNHSFD